MTARLSNTSPLFNDAFTGKKVFITGHTGFKGSWLAAWLLDLRAEVAGYSVDLPSEPSHFEAADLRSKISHHEHDILDYNQLKTALDQEKPDYVFHLAAQAIVRQSYEEPAATIAVNALGSCHLLEALRSADWPCNAVFVTSDKCYNNVEWTWGYRETDELGGSDPYSASKGAAELVIKTYARSFFDKDNSHVKVAVGRAGNVIGGGDWALDRIVPDCIRAWSNKTALEVRNPASTRPWQHVLEPLSGYLNLAAELASNPKLNGEPYNFGPKPDQNFSVQELIETMIPHWPGADWTDSSGMRGAPESSLLKLCSDKALHGLKWTTTLDFEETARFTVDWYREYYDALESDILSLTLRQISDYVALARERNIAWTQPS